MGFFNRNTGSSPSFTRSPRRFSFSLCLSPISTSFTSATRFASPSLHSFTPTKTITLHRTRRATYSGQRTSTDPSPTDAVSPRHIDKPELKDFTNNEKEARKRTKLVKALRSLIRPNKKNTHTQQVHAANVDLLAQLEDVRNHCQKVEEKNAEYEILIQELKDGAKQAMDDNLHMAGQLKEKGVEVEQTKSALETCREEYEKAAVLLCEARVEMDSMKADLQKKDNELKRKQTIIDESRTANDTKTNSNSSFRALKQKMIAAHALQKRKLENDKEVLARELRGFKMKCQEFSDTQRDERLETAKERQELIAQHQAEMIHDRKEMGKLAKQFVREMDKKDRIADEQEERYRKMVDEAAGIIQSQARMIEEMKERMRELEEKRKRVLVEKDETVKRKQSQPKRATCHGPVAASEEPEKVLAERDNTITRLEEKQRGSVSNDDHKDKAAQAADVGLWTVDQHNRKDVGHAIKSNLPQIYLLVQKMRLILDPKSAQKPSHLTMESARNLVEPPYQA